jgi:hypothetical protein
MYQICGNTIPLVPAAAQKIARARHTHRRSWGLASHFYCANMRTHRVPPLDFNMMTTAILVGLMGLVYGQQASITSNGGDITVGLGSSGSLYVQPATGNRLSVATAADTAAIQAAIDMVNNALLTSPESCRQLSRSALRVPELGHRRPLTQSRVERVTQSTLTTRLALSPLCLRTFRSDVPYVGGPSQWAAEVGFVSRARHIF